MVKGKQAIFLALTFMVMVLVIFLAKDMTTALLIISLLTNFLIISSQLTLISERHDEAVGKGSDVMPDAYPWVANTGEGFVDEGIAGDDLFSPRDNFAGSPVWGKEADRYEDLAGHGGVISDYPGGLQEVFKTGALPGLVGPIGPGHLYQSGSAGETSEYPGDPYHLNPLRSRGNRSACDSGPNSEVYNNFDADRTVVEQARRRHDPYRVAAGVMRRKDLMDKYVAEELNEKENEPWWGRAEF